MMDRAWISCEANSEYFYNRLKCLAVLYDEVVIWAPSHEGLNTAGILDFGADKVFKRSPQDDAPFIVAGRPQYFNHAYKFDTPTKRSSPKIAKTLEEYANHCKTIIPDSTEECYDFERAHINDKVWRPAKEEIWRILQAPSVKGSPERVISFAKKMNVDHPTAAFCEFLKNLRTCADCRANALLTDDNVMTAYGTLSQSSVLETNKIAFQRIIQQQIVSPANEENQYLKGLQDSLELFENLYKSSQMPWQDLLRYRSEFLAANKKLFGRDAVVKSVDEARSYINRRLRFLYASASAVNAVYQINKGTAAHYMAQFVGIGPEDIPSSDWLQKGTTEEERDYVRSCIIHFLDYSELKAPKPVADTINRGLEIYDQVINLGQTLPMYVARKAAPGAVSKALIGSAAFREKRLL